MTEVLMPRLSDSMEEGVIIAWLVETGNEVTVGEELVEIETDKANMVYEADAAGVVHHVAKEGDALPVGAPIAQLLKPGELPQTSEAAEESPSLPARENHEPAGETPSGISPSPAVTNPDTETPAPKAATGTYRIKASPLAKRIALDRGIDLTKVAGTGPGGRIVKADVETSTASPARDPMRGPTDAIPEAKTDFNENRESSGQQVETIEFNRLQQTVARRMTESMASIPHFYLSTDVDMSRCFSARAGIKQSAGVDQMVPSFNDMVVKACALALRDFPKANGSYKDDRIELHSQVNVGVAVATEDGLVVPVITDADQRGLSDIATTARELAAKVRDATITPPELSGGTFTVSNLGMFGVSHFDAVINMPQAAILAVGVIEDRPVIQDGQVVAAKMMTVTLSCDHRILYGAEGARFLARIRSNLEEPLILAL